MMQWPVDRLKTDTDLDIIGVPGPGPMLKEECLQVDCPLQMERERK